MQGQVLARAAGIAAMAAVQQQRLGAGDQSAAAAGHQGQPPVVQHCVCWDRQGLQQQAAVAEHRAAGDLIAQGQPPEGWLLTTHPEPLPEGCPLWISLGIDQLGIGVEQQRLPGSLGTGGFRCLKLAQGVARRLGCQMSS